MVTIYLGQVLENVKAALRHGDVHGVCGADVDGCSGFRQNHKLVTVNWSLVLYWVVLHLHQQTRTFE